MNASVILALLLVVSATTNLLQFILYKQNAVRHESVVVANWENLATGSSGDMEIERGFLSVLQEQFELFCKKQHDYGRTNIAVGGEQGLTIRLGDKVSRLFNLLGIGYGATNSSVAPSVDEPLSETFIDVGNYGTIGVMLVRGLWPRMKPEDVWSVDNEENEEPIYK